MVDGIVRLFDVARPEPSASMGEGSRQYQRHFRAGMGMLWQLDARAYLEHEHPSAAGLWQRDRPVVDATADPRPRADRVALHHVRQHRQIKHCLG